MVMLGTVTWTALASEPIPWVCCGCVSTAFFVVKLAKGCRHPSSPWSCWVIVGGKECERLVTLWSETSTTKYLRNLFWFMCWPADGKFIMLVLACWYFNLSFSVNRSLAFQLFACWYGKLEFDSSDWKLYNAELRCCECDHRIIWSVRAPLFSFRSDGDVSIERFREIEQPRQISAMIP